MKILSSIVAVAAFALILSAPIHAQTQGPAPLPPGAVTLDLNAEDTAKLTDSLKDGQHLVDQRTINALTIKSAQSETAAIDAAQKTWASSFTALLESIRASHKWGTDVQFDYQRLAFVRTPTGVTGPVGASGNASPKK